MSESGSPHSTETEILTQIETTVISPVFSEPSPSIEPEKTKKQIRQEKITKLKAILRKPLTYLILVAFLLNVATGAVIFMVLTTWVPTTPYQYMLWIEVNSQIVTALFTLVQFLSFPGRVLNFVRFMKREDKKLQKQWKWYDPSIPGNRRILGAIILVLNANSVFQFLNASAMWGWDYYTRPVGYLVVGLGVALLSPAVAQIIEAVHKKNLKKLQDLQAMEMKDANDDHIKTQ